MAKKRKKRAKKVHSKKRGSHSGRFLKSIIILLCIAIAGVFVYHRFIRSGPKVIRTTRRVRARKNIKLFIAHGEGLKGVSRSVKKGSLKSEISETFTILLWADSGEVIPRGTRLLDVDIRDNTAYLNINRAIKDNHPGGTSTEMQTIYSIVNSITLNYPEIKRVKILIDGKTEKTLAGHIDISVPLGPYRGLIQDS